MCRHREIKDSLCPHRAHGLVRERKHGNGNHNTVSKKHKYERKKHKKRTREKGTKRNPEVLRWRKAEWRHTEVLRARAKNCTHAHTHQHLSCVGVQKKTPSQAPLPADSKLSTVRM